MTVLALGLDLCEIPRIHALLEKHGERFLRRTFTDDERAYCDRNAKAATHYAARFAAKEAVAKALGCGIAEGIEWTDIEVRRAENGQPSIMLHNAAAAKATALGIKQVLVTLTHTDDIAAASVVALG